MDHQSLFDALQLQAWAADEAGMLTYVNDFTAVYFGKSREQLVGEGWQNVLHSADLPEVVRRWTISLETRQPYLAHFRLLRAADRIYRWHRATARFVATPEGGVWIGSNIDVDAERRAEEAFALRSGAHPVP